MTEATKIIEHKNYRTQYIKFMRKKKDRKKILHNKRCVNKEKKRKKGRENVQYISCTVKRFSRHKDNSY